LTDGELTPTALIAELRRNILDRRIPAGIQTLDASASLIANTYAASPDAPQLVWRLAQWADVGWPHITEVARLLDGMSKPIRSALPLRDYAAVRMAQGMVSMASENIDDAMAQFDAALLFEGDLDDGEILAIANYWKARCLRRKGEYDDALRHAVKARHLAFENGFERVAAVIHVLESWVLFQKGRAREALKLLAEAEGILGSCDDPVVLGNIQSAYGRIYRNEGRYDRAIRHFTCAISEYRKLDPRHPHMARTFANMAFVKRLVALDLRRRIDADSAQRRRTDAGQAAGQALSPANLNIQQNREELARICAEALADLDEAAAVCAVHPNHHSEGAVHLNRGLLHLDDGALDLAEREGQAAFALGEEKQDSILMARARILECMVENAKLEEGIGEDPRRHAQAALDYIRDAIGFAQATENRHLLARVHTWHGLTLSNDFFRSDEAAIEAMNAARAYLAEGFHDTAWEDFEALRARVVKSQNVDGALRAWSQGAIGNSTFKEISEQFAGIVIPKVWEQEGRKIARVAARLAISPRKVRRALIRAGLLSRSTKAAGRGEA
jgi:tetratricopeptide (TPR) repeat protein